MTEEFLRVSMYNLHTYSYLQFLCFVPFFRLDQSFKLTFQFVFLLTFIFVLKLNIFGGFGAERVELGGSERPLLSTICWIFDVYATSWSLPFFSSYTLSSYNISWDLFFMEKFMPNFTAPIVDPPLIFKADGFFVNFEYGFSFRRLA